MKRRTIAIGAATTTATLLVVGIVIFCVLVYRSRNVLMAKDPSKTISVDQMEWQTGDLVLCNGSGARGQIGNFMNRLISGSKWSHAGLIYVHPENGFPYLWDTDSESARLIPIRSFLRLYKGKVAIRPLERKHNAEYKKVNQDAFDEYIRKRWGSRFRYNFWFNGYNRYFPALALPDFEYNDKDEKNQIHSSKNYFCVQLLIETCEHAGIVQFPNTWTAKERDKCIREFSLIDLESESTHFSEYLSDGWMYGKELLLVV
jgi:hypothetical protein